MAKPEKHVFVCSHIHPPELGRPSCGACGGKDVAGAFYQQLKERELLGRFAITRTGCLGACSAGPVALVYPEGLMYGKLKPEDVATIIDEHLLGNQPVERLKVSAEVWG
ncbi:(2Fe-2S) ferredoxin domain-containing protein [Thauera aromatica]|uniref:Ferredoxin, 2Fe-2S n=1 Tax=Thauera aromatica K172 TaxID=44139 RepID=A0A2R4BMK8_THAAR|nr:(2Fe-2S) ferredoxin domain-containing protein [Thauera aromatica]AVR88567.1 Ferredoxin, 2Fe-2S [Thauera aromatica K172]MCK2094646.1 (2Fe-2S) ferredoxin domain-containing protein [Thauera aromatica]